MIKLGNRPFKILKEMNNTIIQNILKVLKPGDELYFIGDLAYSPQAYKNFFTQLPNNIKFHWILGNHDKKQWHQYKHYCTSIGDTKETYIGNKIPVYMNHYPHLTWNKSHYGSFMLYGHHHIGSHGTDKLDNLTYGKILNVNIEMNNYQPWSEIDIIKYMEKRPDNWDLIKK